VVMAHISTQEVALDLSCVPIDLSVNRTLTSISISEHINGVEHFSFLDQVAKEATEIDNNCGIDVEAWDDSLWNVTSVLKLAEIRRDWGTDDESSEDECVPWRFKTIEPSEQDRWHSSDTSRESVINELSSISASGPGISESSEFYVFSDPHEEKDFDPEVTVTGERGVGCDEQSTAVISELEILASNGWSVPEPATSVSIISQCDVIDSPAVSTGATSVMIEEEIQPVSTKKRKFDISLLDCWFNDNLEYTNCDRSWRFDIKYKVDEFEDVDDEPMIEVSDSEEGTDIVELPVVETASDSGNAADEHDSRSILCDNDLQIFPTGILLAEICPEEAVTNMFDDNQVNELGTDITEVNSTFVNESGILSDSLEPLMLSDADFDLDELLKTEPNNNSDCDGFISDLLIDLP